MDEGEVPTSSTFLPVTSSDSELTAAFNPTHLEPTFPTGSLCWDKPWGWLQNTSLPGNGAEFCTAPAWEKVGDTLPDLLCFPCEVVLARPVCV
jgi:hypothetical protein